eukprot:m.140143 g.140143  ORF g.140143 m.140143 type:complete len:321 (-) comp30105_c0_seq1:53-1015(-)
MSTAGMGAVPVTTEIMDWFPPESAGKIGVAISSFAIWFVFWLVLAKRKTSARMAAHVAKQQQKKGANPSAVQSIAVEKVDLATRVVGIVHACIVAYASWLYLRQRILAGDDTFNPVSHFLMHASPPPTNNAGGTSATDLENLMAAFDPNMHAVFIFYIVISIGFFIGDSMLTLVLYELYGIEFLFHAVLALSAFIWGLSNDLPANTSLKLVACTMLTEGSTPFLNVLFLLKTYAPTWTRFQMINGTVLIILFFVLRVVFMYSETLMMIGEIQTAYAQGLISAFSHYMTIAMIIGADILNAVWMKKMFKGFTRKLFKSKTS